MNVSICERHITANRVDTKEFAFKLCTKDVSRTGSASSAHTHARGVRPPDAASVVVRACFSPEPAVDLRVLGFDTNGTHIFFFLNELKKGIGGKFVSAYNMSQ